MERFAIKIDKKLKANLYKICRLCGIDNPDMVPIISDKPENDENISIDVEVELEMQQKINLLLGLSITKDDRMPQTMCCLCVDKINDFYEFREMCYATNAQTRKLLGLKNIKKPGLDIKPKLEIKEESIVPTPIPIPGHATASALNKNNKKRKSEEAPLKDEKPDVSPFQPKKKLRFCASESNIKEESIGTTKKKLRFSAMNEESFQTASCSSKKSKSYAVEDAKLKKEPSPPVPVPLIPLAVSNKKLRLAAPPQKDFAIKKTKQKNGKNAEAEIKEEIMEEVKEEPTTTLAHVAKTATFPAKVPQPPKLKFGCNICKERFPAKVNLETHRATHIPKVERYVCTACSEVLSKSFDIKNHQLWHKLSKTPYVCGCCGESILNTYAFSRHLREHAFDTPPALLVLDRECPQCHTSYATNYLYNIHVCAVKTRRCAGCNRLQRNDAEYLKHSAQCAKVYLNYSKHIMPSVEALEDAVRIKNENDVEAAAEEMARISGVSLDMAPVVQLTRLSSPLIMAASHAVSTTGLDDTANTNNRKSGKKGVSKKDLRRVDELLKSTLDALVSIKHEPEVHVDQEAPCAAEQSDNEDHLEMDDHDGGLDDFHHNNETDSENEESSNYASAANTIKSIATAEEGVEQVKIKQEIDETIEENANKIGGSLKLKIKKEHGQLNSSIIEQQKSSDKRAEKRKKKKKHKEKEKDKQKLAKDTQDYQDSNINNNSCEENIGTTTIRIKVEPQDGSDFGEKASGVLQQRPQPEATIMTSIPMMQFQIACVSSGVEFNNAANPGMESHQNLTSANPEVEPEDVKPNREELDRMMKISHVSSGIAMETTETQENVTEGMYHVRNDVRGADDADGFHEERNDGNQRADENVSDTEEDSRYEKPDEDQTESTNEIENNDDTLKDTDDNENNSVSRALQPKSKSTSKIKENRLPITPKSRNKACKSTAKPPNISAFQISSVQSGVTLEPTSPMTTEFSAIYIKPEPQNRGYSDEQPPDASPARHAAEREEPDNLGQAHTEEEQNYISTIDFNNIMIKQEKDIEITDVQITQKSIKSIAKLNGLRRRKQVKDKNVAQNDRSENNDEFNMEDEENQTDAEDEETDSEGIEDEEVDEEADEEEDEEMDEEEEQEEREYRELEYPPELSEEDARSEEKDSAVQENPNETEGNVAFVITNVCTQSSTENNVDNLTKITKQDVTNNPNLECIGTNVLPPSNIRPSNNLELNIISDTVTASSSEELEKVTSSREGVLYNTDKAEPNPSTHLPNASVLQVGCKRQDENNENQAKNSCVEVSQLNSTNIADTHSYFPRKAQSCKENSVDHILQDTQAATPEETAGSDKDVQYNQKTIRTKHLQQTLPHSGSDDHHSQDRTQATKSTAAGLLETLPCIFSSEDHLQNPSQSTSLHAVRVGCEAVRKEAAFNKNTSATGSSCLQSNNSICKEPNDNQEGLDTATIAGFVQQSKDANSEAKPVTVHCDNESVANDENEEEYNDDEEENEQRENDEESTLANNLEERQNDQNQEVLSQIRPTALALHPYLEDISSSSNSLLSNSLSQTPPPPQRQSGTGVNNDFNGQRLLNTEETENILNESNEVAETLAMSASRPITQPILGQPLPPQMPTFNFDNINEIAENNNNANIEREQLQDEQHQHQN